MARSLKLWLGTILVLATVSASGKAPQSRQATQEDSPQKSNRLVTGKIAYVAPMPADLDKWIAEDLRSWRKYQVTANPEGVDLVIRANAPEKDTRYVLRGGVPQPKRERSAPPALSISVVDWVTNQTLWQVDLVERKPKKDEPEPTPGPHTSIVARGLSPDQLGMKIIRKFRKYVEQLEKNGRQ